MQAEIWGCMHKSLVAPNRMFFKSAALTVYAVFDTISALFCKWEYWK